MILRRGRVLVEVMERVLLGLMGRSYRNKLRWGSTMIIRIREFPDNSLFSLMMKFLNDVMFFKTRFTL